MSAFDNLRGELGVMLTPLESTHGMQALMEAVAHQREIALRQLAGTVEMHAIHRLQGEVQLMDNLLSLPERLRSLRKL